MIIVMEVYSSIFNYLLHLLWSFLLLDIHDEMEKFALKHFPVNVRLLKTPRREGLIRARIYGAKQASGQVNKFDCCILLFFQNL